MGALKDPIPSVEHDTAESAAANGAAETESKSAVMDEHAGKPTPTVTTFSEPDAKPNPLFKTSTAFETSLRENLALRVASCLS